MAKLSASERMRLPDSAFAYVDSKRKRRLPIHDESHVRNALARFRQVRFESEQARERARRKLLQAAKRYGIVPVGFIEGELRSAHKKAAAGRLIIELGRIESSSELEAELRRTLGDPELMLLRWSKPEGTYIGCDDQPVALPGPASQKETAFLQGRGRPLMAIVHDREVLQSAEITEAVMAAVHLVTGKEVLEDVDEMGVATAGLPDGEVTFVLTDIEGSTQLLHELGDQYVGVLADVRRLISEAVLRAGGRQVEARADEYVAVFEHPAQAIEAASSFQRAMAAHRWPDGHDVRVRAGVHAGPIVLTESGYVGLTVHAAARIMAAAHGGQVLVSADCAGAVGPDADATFTALGAFELRGLAGPLELMQLDIPGFPTDFPAPAV